MGELLSQSERSLIFIEENIDGKEKIIWKTTGHGTNSLSELNNEYQVTTDLSIPGVRSPLKKGIYQNKEAFAYEYIEGSSLETYLSRNQLDWKDLLSLMNGLVGTLKQLHQSGVYHLRINTSNILYNPEKTRAYLVDFSIAGNGLSDNTPSFENWGNELGFMAPEQARRLDQAQDARTDLYSLGVVLYRALTGKNLFSKEDRADLIHDILVKAPKSIQSINPEVPSALDNLVSKLLSKNPKDRYQTTHGLEHDIAEILTRSANPTWDGTIELASEDHTDKLYPSEALYGREKEISTLEGIFEDIEQKTESRVCILSGKAGMGKSTLMNSFRKSIEQKGALLISGKFERLGQSLPHQAMVGALKELATHILSQQDSQLEHWKKVMNNAVDGIGGILIDLVPEFKYIVDADHEETTLKSIQTESRINFLFQKVIEAAATPTSPLVLFFDDMHWADEASLKSLISILGNRYTKHFLFIGAYNLNESEELPLQNYLPKIIEERPDTVELELKNLSEKDVKYFVKDSIKVRNAAALSELIYRKTLGNPFFVRGFLEQLYVKGILKSEASLQQWSWDASQAEGLQISDSAIEFMNEQVHSLDEEHQNLLNKAALIGKSFSRNLLESITHLDSSSISAGLKYLVKSNLIISEGDGNYSFLHDRIQQTAYRLLDKSEANEFHYKIANLLKDRSTNAGNRFLFEIARHYQLGEDYETPADRLYLKDLYSTLGIESKKNASFNASYEFLSKAIQRVSTQDWSVNYAATLNLFHEGAESGMMTGHRQEAQRWLDEALNQAKNIEDRVKAHEIKLNHLCETHQFAETIDYLLLALDEIGYGVKRNPSKITILKEYATVKWQLRNKKIEDIPDLPLMEDVRAKAFLKLTVMATVSIYGWATDILPIIFFRQVKLSLKYGNSEYSPYGYAAFGFALIAFMGDLKRGLRFGEIGLKLLEKLNAQVVKTKVNVVFYAFLSFWKNGVINSFEPLKEAYITGRQTGDLFYASFALHFTSAIKLQAGKPLGALSEIMVDDGLTIQKMGQEMVHFTFEIQRMYIKSLNEEDSPPLLLHSKDYEKETIEKMEALDDIATIFEFYYYKMALAFIANNYDLAYEYGMKAVGLEDETTPWQITYPNFVLILTLSLIKSLSSANEAKNSSKNNKLISQKLKLLRTIAKKAPQNYQNKYDLAMALYHQSKGKNPEAHASFIQSIQKAKESDFIHEEALAREHFAYFLMETNQNEFGEGMLQKAFNCYQLWQANSKCKLMKEENPDLIKSISKRQSGIGAYQNIYDLNTIIQSNQALSSENTLNGLLNTMTKMMMDNASVSYVVIALKGNSQELNAIAYSDQDQVLSGHGHHTNAKHLFPNTVTNVVGRTLAPLVSANLSLDARYNFDPYIQSEKPTSVCCLPITNKGMLLGIVYLENNLAENAFDHTRVEFFQTITAQLAISLDNVMLYTGMEQKVHERTQELVEKNDELAFQKKKSDDLLLNILPEETAEELKTFGKTTAKSYDSVTVMFIDIKSFSHIAESMTPQELVAELDFCFQNFDSICAEFGLEKIKTIGDAYMAAGGIPENNKASAQDVINAAIAMLDFTTETRIKRQAKGEDFFEIRVGIHTGPVVAGVVGTKKFQYDIWGNTVNLAARMEQNSEPGKINISQATYDLIKNEYSSVHRGKISAKNMGDVDMYFIEATNVPS